MTTRNNGPTPDPERVAELEREIARLRREAEQFRELAMGASECLVVVQDGRLIFHNPPFADLVSYRPEEISSAAFVEFVHPDDRAGLMTAYAGAMSPGAAPTLYEFRTVAKNGAIRWYRIHARAGDWGGRPALLCSLEEVTSLKRTEAKYRDLLDMVPAGVFEMDLEAGRFLSVNDLMCEVLGYTRGELMAMDVEQIMTPKSVQASRERLHRAVKGLPVAPSVEYQIVGKDGREVWVLLTSRIARHADGSVTSLAVAQDITEKKRHEEEQRQVERLESLGVLAGGIAHDFNNLLTAILGNVTVGRRYSATGGRATRVFDEVERACGRARRLTQQLLTFSQGGEPIRQVTEIAPTIVECAMLAVRGSSSLCVFDLSEDLWRVDVDEGQIGQVITNLVINAEQAMPDGGTVTITASNVDIGAGEPTPAGPGRFVRVSVADAGAGIAPEVLPRVFDPYFSTKPGGSGLGLATARSILKRHDGDITIETEEGAGTTIHLFLPATEARPRAGVEAQPSPEGLSGQILFMDDDDAVRELGLELLAELGFEPVAARSGEEAVELFADSVRRGAPFAAVVLDLTVSGGMGGKEALARIRDLDPSVAALVTSGYSNDPVLADPGAYGFSAAVAKPFTLEQIGAALARLLG